jgi:hypothetical protein
LLLFFLPEGAINEIAAKQVISQQSANSQKKQVGSALHPEADFIKARATKLSPILRLL